MSQSRTYMDQRLPVWPDFRQPSGQLLQPYHRPCEWLGRSYPKSLRDPLSTHRQVKQTQTGKTNTFTFLELKL